MEFGRLHSGAVFHFEGKKSGDAMDDKIDFDLGFVLS